MNFGCPILTSHLDFAEYVCGNSAKYFNPWKVDSIKNAILELKNNSELQNKLATEGKRRLSELSGNWHDVAQPLINKIETIFQSAATTDTNGISFKHADRRQFEKVS
jgi:hypothetical protein